MDNPEFVNFCRLACLLLETSSKVLAKRIEVFCHGKHLTFEQFLTKIRHDLFHMWQPSKCCQCKTAPMSSKRTLFRQQFDKLYCSIGLPIPGHTDKKQSQVCSCHTVPISDINPSDIDISLSSLILLHFCELKEGDRATVHTLRSLRNEHIAHAASAKISDDKFQELCNAAEIEILAIAKCFDQECFDQIRAELTAIQSREINESTGEVKMKLVWKHYVSSRCLFEEVYDVFDMLQRKSQEIPEKLEHIIEIVEPVGKEIADDMKQMSKLIGQSRLLHDRSKIKRHFGFWLRQLQELFPDIAFEDSNEDFGDKDMHEDLKNIRICSVRENNIACTKTEIETHKNGKYLRVRAVLEAEKKLNAKGIITFIGKTGSGKSTHSLELLHQASNGKIFQEPHDIIHLSHIDDWEHLVLPSKNTLVYIEDPLGRTSANVSLIQNDGGIFQKIWSCVQEGKIKLIMTVRSTIMNEYLEDLDRYPLFNSEYVVDLSSGKFKMNSKEREELIKLYCEHFQVQIVHSDENIHLKDTLQQQKIKLAKSTIQTIIKKDPAIGFPLCLKNFLGNKTNISLGLNYFNTPTQTQLREVENLAKSRHSSDRCQFIILVLVMLHGGRLSESKTSSEKLQEIGVDFNLRFINRNLLTNALKKLKNKSFLYFVADDKSYKYSHDTILEAVFTVYTTLMPNKVDLLIKEADTRIIYEMIRTSNYVPKHNEPSLILEFEMEPLLVSRFISELRRKNIKDVILHPAMTDKRFRINFFYELKKKENVGLLQKQDSNGNSIFILSCLFNRSAIVQFMLETSEIPKTLISEGFELGLTLDNAQTISVLLPYLSQHEIHEHFLTSCNTGKKEIVESFIENKDKICQGILKKAFHILCSKGRKELVEVFLRKNQNMSHDLIVYGFPAACENSKVQTVELLLNEAKCLTHEQVRQWLICLSHLLVGQHLLRRLFYTYSSVSVEFISSMFYNMCSSRNIPGVEWLLQETCLTDDIIVEVLMKASKNQNNDTTNDSDVDKHNSRYQLNTGGLKLRSKSTECNKIKPRVISNKNTLHRQRSVSDSDSVTEPSVDLIDSPINFQPNSIIQKSCDGETLSEIVSLVLSKRKGIKSHHLRDFLLSIFQDGKINCLKSILSERPHVQEVDIIDGIRLASLEHHFNVVELILQRGTLSPYAIHAILNNACDTGNEVILRLILAKHSISQATVIEKLEQAIRNKNERTIEAILQIELYLPERVLTQIVTFLCKSGDHVLLQIVLDHRVKEIPSRIYQQCFHRACHDGHVNIIEQLLVKCHKLEEKVLFDGLFAACISDKYEAVRMLLSKRTNFPEPILTESLIIACLNYSLKTIDTIVKIVSLSQQTVNQVALVCLHTRPSLFRKIVDLDVHKLESQLLYTQDGSNRQSVDPLIRLLKKLGYSYSTSSSCLEGEISECYHKSLHMLALYGNKLTIKSVLTGAFYMSDWMITEIMKKACEQNRHAVVHTICEIKRDFPLECIQQGLTQAFEHNSIESIKCILDMRQDMPECYIKVGFLNACRSGSTDLVTTLLYSRKDLTIEFIEHGLTVAVLYHRSNVVEQILFQRSDIPSRCWRNIFAKACVNGDHVMISKLLQFNLHFDIEIVIGCFFESCVFNLASNVEIILKLSNIPPENVLHGFKSACTWNNVETLHKILVSDSSIDYDDVKKQLHLLCIIGKAKTILTIVNCRQHLKIFAFLKCCELGRLKVVKTLIKGNLFQQDDINNGIKVAGSFNQNKIIDCILHLSEIHEDHIAQHLKQACKGSNLEVVECILKRTQDISVTIVEECFSIACNERNLEIVSVILDYRNDMERIVQVELNNAIRNEELELVDVIFKKVILNDKLQAQALQEAFSVQSSSLVMEILQKCHYISPRNMYNGIAWLDRRGKQYQVIDTIRTRVGITSRYLVSVLKYACKETNISVIEIILSSHPTFTQNHLQQILKMPCFEKYVVVEMILNFYPHLIAKLLLQILNKSIEQQDVVTMDTILKSRNDVVKRNEFFLLHKAVESGENEILKTLLKNADYESLDSVSFALKTAFGNDNIDMCDTILQRSQDVDKHIMQLIFESCKNNNHEFVKSVVRNRKKISTRKCCLILVKATQYGRQDIVRTILQKNPDITGDDIRNLNSVNKSSKIKTICMLEKTRSDLRMKRLNRLLFMFLVIIHWIAPSIIGPQSLHSVKRRRKKKRKSRHKGSKKKTNYL